MKRGKAVALTLGRRFIIEHCHFSNLMQKGVFTKTINIAPLIRAMNASPKKPALTLVFLKAFAVIARDIPELRRSYIKLPWPQLHELDYSVGMIPVTRNLEGEEIVLMAKFRDPANATFADLSAELEHQKTAPVRDIKNFDRVLKFVALPWPLRRFAFWIGLNSARHKPKFYGTFGVSSVGTAEAIYAIHPLTTLLTYGVIDAASGSINVNFSFDHRVFDGMVVARALTALETALNGEIADEIARKY
jgi:hypothetical protein